MLESVRLLNGHVIHHDIAIVKHHLNIEWQVQGKPLQTVDARKASSARYRNLISPFGQEVFRDAPHGSGLRDQRYPSKCRLWQYTFSVGNVNERCDDRVAPVANYTSCSLVRGALYSRPQGRS
ncbi:hypothetical protein J6590_074602 [Homalodisca vitripennis]|nr:hypothetical protein J6590_074602 [Homalodisca vitripennis]